MKNYGFQEKIPSKSEILLGASVKTPPKKILQPSRDWSLYLPMKEYQSNKKFDTYGCVSFSFLNNVEIFLKRAYGIDINFSDRFLTVMSGTIIGFGNYFDRVANFSQYVGLVKEEVLPFSSEMTQQEYYSLISDDVKNVGKQFLKEWSILWEWVDWGGCDPDVLWENLQYGPLQASVYAWNNPVNGIYERDNKNNTNHAVTIYYAEYGNFWLIYDHYDNVVKKLAWDFYFGSSIRVYLERNMFRLIKGDTRPEVYMVGEDGVLHHIAGELSFQEGTKAGMWGDWQSWDVLPQSQVDAMPKGRAFGFIH